MTVAQNDIIRVTAVMTGASGEIANVYEFRANLVLDGNDTNVMADLAIKIDNVYQNLVDNMADDIAFTEIRGYNVTQGYPMPISSWPTLTAGTHSGGFSGAAQLSALGLLRTGVNRVLGRKFFGPFIRDAIIAGGAWNGNITAAVSAALGELIGSFIASGTLNTYLPGVKAKSGAFWAFIEGIAAANPVVQRRRRYGRGA